MPTVIKKETTSADDPLRERLINAAYRAYIEGGLKALTMRRVGDIAGVSAMAAYVHFKNKDELLAALVDKFFLQFIGELQKVMEIADPVERFRDSGRRVLRYALDHPDEYELIFVRRQDRAKLQLSTHHTDWRGASALQFLSTLIQACIDAGEISGAEAYPLAVAVWSQTHGQLAMVVTGRYYMPLNQFEEMYWRSLDLLIDPYLRVPYNERESAK